MASDAEQPEDSLPFVGREETAEVIALSAVRWVITRVVRLRRCE